MKKLTTLLLLLTAIAVVFAQPYPPADYTLSSDQKTLQMWKGSQSKVNMEADAVLKKVTTIGPSAFKDNTTLTSIILPQGLDIIAFFAFKGCTKLSGGLVIPNNVTNIGNEAFADCEGFNGKLTIGNKVDEIAFAAFANCAGFIGDLTIPDSIETVGFSAFGGCSGFDGKLTIGNKVKKIEGKAFSDCAKFTGDLTIPDNVETIEHEAFWGCSGFNGKLTIGNKMKTIGRLAFGGCSGLKTIQTLATEPPAVTDNDAGLLLDIPLTVPPGSLEAYKNHDYWGKFSTITDGTVPSFINKVERLAKELRFYPSPVESVLTIECEKGIETYALYNETGILLQSKIINNKQQTQLLIDMANYPSGVYFIRLLGQEGTKTIKLIKK